MDIKLELLKKHISDFINCNLEDFEAVEKIVCVFNKNDIDFGVRHDF